MLYSQGVPLEALGVPSRKGPSAADPREAWRVFASHQHLFRGTPSAMWLAHVFHEVFGFEVALDASTADLYFDRIGEALQTAAFRPRALFDRFNIELLATTESPIDELAHHRAIRESGWGGRVVTAYRPDPVIDAEHEDFWASMERFGQMTGQDVAVWSGLSGGAPHPPPGLHRGRRDLHRPRPPHGGDGGSAARRGRGRCSTASSTGPGARRTPSSSAPRCSPRWPR